MDLWPAEEGRHPPAAYQSALGIILALQAVAFLWFARPTRCELGARHLSAHRIHALAAMLGVPAAVAIPYLKAREDWRALEAIAQRQVSSWRSVALVSIVTTAAISSALLLPTSSTTPTTRAEVASQLPARTVAARVVPTNMAVELRQTNSPPDEITWARRRPP